MVSMLVARCRGHKNFGVEIGSIDHRHSVFLFGFESKPELEIIMCSDHERPLVLRRVSVYFEVSKQME